MKPMRNESGKAGAVPQPTRRRGILLSAGAAAAAGAVAVLAPRSPDAAAEPSVAKQARTEDSAGYRASEHVRRYYETART